MDKGASGGVNGAERSGPKTASPWRSLIRTLIPRQSLVDLANLSFLGVLLAFYLLAYPRLTERATPLLVILGLMALLWIATRYRQNNTSATYLPLLMLVYSVAFLFLAFESLHLTLPYFNHRRYDGLMISLDHAAFGVHPTVWLEGITSRPLTEVMYVLYFLYFPMPLVLLGWMLAKGRYAAAEDAVFRLLCCYFTAYAIYFLVPVQGPRFALKDVQTVPLNGYLLAEPIRVLIDRLEPNKLDAFPSLHAAILSVTLAITRRENRPMYLVFLALGAGILFSLVYLRYHYVVDVAAGLILAAAAYALGGAAWSRYRRRFAPHFGRAER